MKHIATATTLVAMLAAPAAIAQDVTLDRSGSAFGDFEIDESSLHVSDIMGSTLYATEGEIPDDVDFGASDDWIEMGQITDFVLDPEGSIDVALVAIGGFFGLGERDIAVSFEEIEIVPEINGSNGYFFVIEATRNEIESAPPFEREGTLTE